MSGTILKYPDFDPSLPYQCMFLPSPIPHYSPYCTLGTIAQQYQRYMEYQRRLLSATPQCFCVDDNTCKAQRMCSACDMNRSGECPFLHSGWDIST